MQHIEALLTGRAAPLGQDGAVSGIAKLPASGPLWLAVDGLRGDEQGDRQYHGGPEKALHHYASEHYPHWLARFGDAAPLRGPGAFGENIATLGMTEHSVHVGDVYRIGGALVQVSQGRQPCWKLNLRFGQPDAARAVQESGLTGWYYRVLRPGWIAPGDLIELQERPLPDWPLARLIAALFLLPPQNPGQGAGPDAGPGPGPAAGPHAGTDAGLGSGTHAGPGQRGTAVWHAEWQAAAALVPLAEGWRANFRQRLERGGVEGWARRLNTPNTF